MPSLTRSPAYYFGLAAFFAALLVLGLLGASPGFTATDRYLPHGFCYAWQPGLMRLHVVSDALIGLAYTAIPVALVQFIRKRTDLPFNWMFLLFGVFIVACGATHWMEVWTLWNPSYWVSGSVKVLTAAASVPTAILLFFLIPRALKLPSVAQLEAANAALAREVRQRTEAEAALEQARRQLEERVRERTAELSAANATLEMQRAELARADRGKSDFLAVLSHELRNPVQAIRTSTHVIRTAREAPLRDAAGEAIERQVSKLAALLEELLDVVNAAAPRELKRVPVTIEALVRAAVDTTQAAVESRRQRVVATLRAPDAWVDVDATRIEQALANVLANASKYSPRASDIDVSTDADAQLVVVRVRDRGIGIPQDELPRLFELFHRGRSALDSGTEGLGVGLHIAKQLIRAHDGSIEAHSTGLGQGSEFVIRLPRVQPPPAVQHAGGPAQPRAMRPLRVLIVDDNRDAADSIAILLDLAGHDVEVAYEGLPALELARRNVPDVALLDIGLPTLDGYDLARALSTLDPRPRMIAITGWGTAEDQAKARAAGFDRHMTKPVDPQRVLEALAEFDPPPKTAS